MLSKSEELFEKGSVWNSIAKMSIPAVITMIVMLVYNMADTYFVGKTGDPLQLAAISLASPVYMIMMAVGTLVGGGGCAAAAGAIGKKDIENVKAICSACTVIVIAASLITGGAILIFADPILSVIGADQSTWDYTKSYMCVLALGIIFIVFSNSFSNIIRAEGAAKESMIGNGIGTLINIVLGPIFILVLNMGVMGAAIATVIGNIAASIYYLVYMNREQTYLCVNPVYLKGNGKEIFTVISLGIPNAISNLFSGIVNTITNHLLMAYGAATIAAVGVGGKAGMIVAMLVMGICMGSSPIIAYNYAAGNRKRTKDVLMKLSILTVIIGTLLKVCCYIKSSALAALFLEDEALVQQSSYIMKIQLLMMPVVGIYYVGINFLQSARKAKWAAILSAFRQFICYIPTVYLLHGIFGLSGIYWVNVLCDGLAVILSLILTCRMYRQWIRQCQRQLIIS